ncbi:MAG: glycosyltransferase family 1 protein [Fastidiosipilaceae bacterium]
MAVRVLQIVVNLGHNGIDHLVMELYRHIDRERYQFDFIAHGEAVSPFEEEVRQMGGRIFYIPTMTENYFASQRRLLDIIEENRYQIAHSHQDSMSGWSLKKARQAGVPVRVAHAHTTDRPKGLRGHIYRMAARGIKTNANYFLGCTNFAAQFMFGERITASERCHILKNAIQTERFQFSEETRAKTRAELGLTDELAIINVGRLSFAKNHEFLLLLFDELRRKDPRAVLLIAGQGELSDKLIERAKELEIEDKVRFLGARSDIPQLLQAADIMVMPSLFEGLPLAAVEAQTSGLPVLFADTIDPISAFSPETEFLSLSESPRRWAERTLELAHLPSPRQDRIEPAKQSGFDISIQADKLADHYDRWLEAETKTR